MRPFSFLPRGRRERSAAALTKSAMVLRAQVFVRSAHVIAEARARGSILVFVRSHFGWIARSLVLLFSV